MLRAAVDISIHQPSRALHPLTASYIKIEMTSKDSIKIKKYKRRYMCKTWLQYKTPFDHLTKKQKKKNTIQKAKLE